MLITPALKVVMSGLDEERGRTFLHAMHLGTDEVFKVKVKQRKARSEVEKRI